MSLLGLASARSAEPAERGAMSRAGGHAPRRATVPVLVALLALLTLPAVASAAGNLGLTEVDSGREVTVAPGAEITIALTSNASTGYHWIVATEPDPDVLVAAPDNGEYAAPETDLIGAAGAQTFTYTADGEGSTWLLLHYVAPGTNEVGETFELYVDVRAGADDDGLPATTASGAGEAGGPGGNPFLLVSAALAIAAAGATMTIRRRRSTVRA